MSSPTTVVPHSHGPGVPQQSRGERFTSYDVEAFEVPGGREEDWRFTPLNRLHGLHGPAVAATGSVTVTVAATAPVTVETVDRDDSRIGSVGIPADRVAARAWSSFTQATVVTVPSGAQVDEPVVVSVQGGSGTAFAHLLVDIRAHAKATVVISGKGAVVLADNVEVRLGDGARLSLVTVEDWDRAAVHLGQYHIRVGRDATFTHVVATLGGDLVRLTPTVTFDGPGGDATLYGVYFADAGQHQEHRLLVDHNHPHCRSRVAYKGALQGAEAHTVWIGDVLIRAHAEGTDTYELNRNLVLTEGARADSVPNLEIETGEIVGAGHASATGRFDDEQLFYLQSRGLTESEARRLVVRGFFAEIIAHIGIPALQDELTARVDRELAEGRR